MFLGGKEMMLMVTGRLPSLLSSESLFFIVLSKTIEWKKVWMMDSNDTLSHDSLAYLTYFPLSL